MINLNSILAQVIANTTEDRNSKCKVTIIHNRHKYEANDSLNIFFIICNQVRGVI